MQACRAAAGAVLSLCALQAAALSSGPPRGTPLLGRPLQLAIPVSWEGGTPCVRADLQQGESPAGALRWRLEQTSEGNGVLRLSSAVPIQEPVITVQLALGCASQYAREYVLLADPPGEEPQGSAAADALARGAGLALAPATSLALVPAPGDTATAAPAAPARGEGAAPTRPRRAREAAVASAGSTLPPARARSARPAEPGRSAAPAPRDRSAQAVARAPETVRKTGAPRLKLEPIDIAIDEAPVLRISTALGQLPAAGNSTRGQAQGLWQALNLSPEQNAAQLQAARAMEGELRTLRELVQRQGADTRVLNERLERVSAERDLMLKMVGGFALFLGAAFMYLLWLRTREAAARRAWWEREEGAGSVGSAAPRATPTGPGAGPASAMPVAAGMAGAAASTGAAAAPVAAATPNGSPASSADSPDDSGLIDLPDFTDFGDLAATPEPAPQRPVEAAAAAANASPYAQALAQPYQDVAELRATVERVLEEIDPPPPPPMLEFPGDLEPPSVPQPDIELPDTAAPVAAPDFDLGEFALSPSAADAARRR